MKSIKMVTAFIIISFSVSCAKTTIVSRDSHKKKSTPNEAHQGKVTHKTKDSHLSIQGELSSPEIKCLSQKTFMPPLDQPIIYKKISATDLILSEQSSQCTENQKKMRNFGFLVKPQTLSWFSTATHLKVFNNTTCLKPLEVKIPSTISISNQNAAYLPLNYSQKISTLYTQMGRNLITYSFVQQKCNNKDECLDHELETGTLVIDVEAPSEAMKAFECDRP